MYTIYKATNKITNKSYIGFDCNWPYRKTAHKHAVKRGSNLVFHNAIRKYGWENFEWSILEQSENREYVHIIQGLKRFCIEHNLHTGNMCSVAKGKLKHYKKWLCKEFI